MDLGWYLNRLRRMSLPEVAYRARKVAQSRLEKSGIGLVNTVPAPNLAGQGASWFALSPSIAVEPYTDEADRILAGKLSIFALENVDVGFPPRWNCDYRTGVEAPITFGKTLNYRDETLVGDIKYLWEPNRHLHIVTLAQAYYLTKDQRYLDGVIRCFMSWFEQCPYPLGPNWVSSLELAIRLINWSIVWELIGGLNSPAFDGGNGQHFKRAWIDSIYRHAHFIQGYFSRFSSANNHLIGEAVGLVVSNARWPFWPELESWAVRAKGIIEEEAIKQITEDGVDREQTTAYQQFVFEFLLIAGLSIRAAGDDFTPICWRRLEAMAEFVLSIRDAGGNVPMIGDADDGYVTRLDPSPAYDPYRSMLCTAGILFDRDDFKRSAWGIDVRNRWLFGEMGESALARAQTVDPVKPPRHAFADAGYFVLSHKDGEPGEIKLVVDCGPLGYSAIAAHGHADALSFTLSLGGREVLVDPGTYAYHTQKKWRDYFRGTSAHNTVRIDRQDQSVIGGNFMWMHHANARCTKFVEAEDLALFEGEHDGYRRLDDPVMHRRSIRLTKSPASVEIVDAIECADSHFVEQFWHFAEDVRVSVDGRRATAEVASGKICLDFDENMTEIIVERGNESIPAGWISRRFDVKVPTTTIVCRRNVAGNAKVVTGIACIPVEPAQA